MGGLIDMSTIQELAAEVQRMRVLQRNYFATRNRSILQESKEQERKVDQMINEIFSKAKQLDLLGGES
jgi:CHASE3 domain sensor protein